MQDKNAFAHIGEGAQVAPCGGKAAIAGVAITAI